MAIYSIRDLEKLTGIKAHTIRIWEQRYRLIEPDRTETNIRYYTDDNLRELFNIALLNRNGYKISKLAQMSPEEINLKVAEIAENSSSQNTQIDALTLAMIDLDEAKFEQVFSDFIWEHGFEKAMLELIYPFLDKLNVLWLAQSVNPVHEKFISNLIQRKLMCAIDKEPADPAKDASTFLLYLPEGENQEITLLFIHYLLRTHKQKAVYLGADISLAYLKSAVQTLNPDFVFTILNEPLSRQSIQGYVDHAASIVDEGTLLLTGAQLFFNQVKTGSNTRVLSGLPDTLTFLDKLQIQQRTQKA
jgi:DNA-binding transcriptional MerR regulator